MTPQVHEFSLLVSDGRISTLRRKIGWIRQAIRGLLVFNAVFSLALGQVQKTAAEIADDHAQIV